MSCISGPNITRDKLVFGLDTGSSRFYTGEPTTNLLPYTDYSDRTYGYTYDMSSWGGDAATAVYYQNGGLNNLPYKKMTKTSGGSGGSYNDDFGFFAISNSTTYTLSCYMKASRTVTLNGYAWCLNRRSDNAYRVPQDPTLTTEWTQFTWVYNAGASDAGSDYTVRTIVYVDDSLPVDIYWCGFQLEQKTHATPYVNGSRSSTQSLLDLTGTYSINVSSLLFDSVAQPYFNGSNYISINANSWIRTSSFVTMSGWYYHSGTTLGGPWGILTNVPGTSTSDGMWWHINYSGNLYLRTEDNTNGEYDATYTPFVSTGNWYHIVTVVGTNKFDIYVNGTLNTSWSPTFSWSLINSDTAYLTIGYSYNEGVIGYIKEFTLYNKALSASEILQNYNCMKKRFGL